MELETIGVICIIFLIGFVGYVGYEIGSSEGFLEGVNSIVDLESILESIDCYTAGQGLTNPDNGWIEGCFQVFTSENLYQQPCKGDSLYESIKNHKAFNNLEYASSTLNDSEEV